MNKDIGILIGIAGAAIVAGIVASKVEKSVVKAEIKKARDELFDVSPGCESISFKGSGEAPNPDRLAEAGTYYFRPFLREKLGQGMDRGLAPGEIMVAEADILAMSVPEVLTANVLYELFPECVEREPMPWPPETIFSNFGVIWIFMSAYVLEQMNIVMAELSASS